MKLDAIDKKLLVLLQKDSKQTTKQLSLFLGLSVTAVYERIKKLEREGVITQYVAIVDKEKIEKSFLAFCHLKLEKHAKENIIVFEKEITKLEEVTECFHVSGNYDYILKIYVKDMNEYRDFMVNKLTALKHIESTYSTFAIGKVKSSKAIIL
ncbi:Lrp/AsnC family transcriptional regulator [Tenacibaculum sp. AHE15PA]|uniref:Lrp/AsnC family transcriptional regulator n=1 Tax=unclassified Tenacibaculum TaxID=2635139 RepID=UPI001C4F0D05|nr:MULTISPECIES: Lrp/AsnC family transcriptional regulator [unclassified Tenacibaculum]QXP73457.1 Lrp/AsnC family transcriptional regulator [Tenacibaculum sp. AHE14PA]QXP74971.1 Lrp/AsnC family transcriptional regulator [Tenacibaculum sp. AHE15PA]